MIKQKRSRRNIALIGASILLALAGTSERIQADDIFVSGDPGALVVSSADAGSQPNPVADASTSYSIDITTSNKKITGAIDSAMPAGTLLRVTFTAPTGATSTGQITLGVTAQDLVTGLVAGMNESGLSILYEFSATVGAGIVAPATKTVTFTIIDN